jgi:choline monooxygenase
MTPELGDFHVLDWLHDGGKMLVNNPNGIELLSNVCRHRQAQMLKGGATPRTHRLPLPSLDL